MRDKQQSEGEEVFGSGTFYNGKYSFISSIGRSVDRLTISPSKRNKQGRIGFQGTVKDVHSATVKNDLVGMKKKLEDPVSPIILRSKDGNGLNVLHKVLLMRSTKIDLL